MSAVVAVLAAVAAIALAAVALALLALSQTHLLRRAARHSPTGDSACEAEIALLRSSLEACAAQVRELQERPPSAAPLSAPRAALNLAKRSQAIRMHRHGDSAGAIAAALEIPRQEVDLLLKVHRIVIGTLGT